MKLLKAALYLVLSLCLVWGITVTLGPTVISFVLSKSFGGQQIRLTGLSISPKLQISASRAEFDFSDHSQSWYGEVRAPKFKIYPTMSGWLVQISSGLMIVNDKINLSSFKADFRTRSITNVDVGQFSLTSPEFAVEDRIEFNDIKFSSDAELSSSEVRNLTFTAQTAFIRDTQNGNVASLDMITGSLAKLFLRQDWERQVLDFELSAEKFKLQSAQFGKVKIKSLSMEAKNDGSVVDAVMMAESLSLPENNLYLQGVKVEPSFDLSTSKFQKETSVQVDQGRFEQNKPNKVSGNIVDLDAIVGLHLPERVLKVASNVTLLEIWNDQFPLITIPKLALDIQAVISPLAQVQEASAQFKAAINDGEGAAVRGELAFKLFNQEGQDCLTVPCVASDVLFDVEYDFEGEQVICKGRCSSGKCDDKTIEFIVETSDTSKIVMGLNKQKIVNPLAVIMIAGGIMQGEKVGFGHKIKF